VFRTTGAIPVLSSAELNSPIETSAVSIIRKAARQALTSAERSQAPGVNARLLVELSGATVLTVVFIALSTWAAMDSAAAVNPDGVSYARVADHYLRGRFDLAVNSWWSPAYSILLLPAMVLQQDPFIAARIINSLAAVGVALCCALVVHTLGGGRIASAAYAVALIATASWMWSVPVITPDMLFAFAIMVFAVAGVRHFVAPSTLRAAVFGVAGGAAFLVKSYGFPFVAAALLLTTGLGILSRRARILEVRHAALAFAGFLMVAGPWIITISLHDDRFTIGSSGHYSATYSRLARLGMPTPQPPPRPLEQGRFSHWESPRDPVTREPLPVSGSPTRDRIMDLSHNARVIARHFRSLDPSGTLSAALIFCAALLVFGWRLLERQQALVLAWLLFLGCLFAAGYIPLLVEPRYLWPANCLMLAFTAGTAATLLPRLLRSRATFGAAAAVLAVVVMAAIARDTVRNYQDRRDWREHGLSIRALAEAVRERHAGHCLVSNHFAYGLALTHWGDLRLLGTVPRWDPTSVDALVSDFGPILALISGDSPLAEELSLRAYPIHTKGSHALFLLGGSDGANRAHPVLPAFRGGCARID
jgi:4-amino-4-deoxy-L-arabinose transferase-like glycosyltransferase